MLNAEGLRYDDEFAKHKILDAIGDLYNAGHPLLASYTPTRAATRSTTCCLRALFADPAAYELVTFDDASRAPQGMAELAPAW